MRLSLKFSGNIYNLMRQLGYHPEGKDEKTGEFTFGRRLSADDYPRFHIYLKVGDVARETLGVNLHLDQKKPIYKGAPSHAAEYEGESVEREAERIRRTITGL